MLISSGCRKDREIVVSEKAISFSTKRDAKIYLNKKLNEYGKILAKLAQNPEMRKLVDSRVAEKFDGDYNVLLKDLIKPIGSTTVSLKSSLQMSTTPINTGGPAQQLNLQALQTALTQPLEINGQTFYPQIYIPFFEEQQSVPIEPIDVVEPGTPIFDPCLKVIPKALERAFVNPVIVRYDGEEIAGQETFLGFTNDQNGVLIENIPVDECFAKRHRVWAITLNERSGLSRGPKNTSADTPEPSIHNIGQVAFIKNMKVKANKESWIKGGNELQMTWSMSWKDGINPSTNTYAVHPFELKFWIGYNIKYISTISLGDFTKRDVKKGRVKNLNIDYAVFGNPTSFVAAGSEWNTMKNWYNKMGTYIYYVVYENDTWADIDVDIPIPFPKSGFPNTVKVIALTNNSPYISGAIKIVPVGFISPQNNDMTSRTVVNDDEIEFYATHKP
ncbi:hypothetical protein EZJ43_12685 [Pedobacter changchengzhani]|uniref:Uncharacterized protein n=1 Tax=Pedobacter changchengzhani TaxID=2529274 RepID=A0A4R5MIX2_9SPHI|nr:hypothetical protein [Pedobacter changchengzhani]TDG35478.1 hypothetical protein EZJ43_12685 [Pedobacter changchengzhani]